MSSKFKLNKDDRNIADIQLDITQDSKMNSIEWHLAEKIYIKMTIGGLLNIPSKRGVYPVFENLTIDYKIIFLNLAKEILGEEKQDDNSRQN